MVHEFRIPVGFEEKVVTINVDEQTGKASIRVDGRMTGRPMAPDEETCEIRVGTDRYEVRRDGDSFDVAFIGPAEAVAIAMKPPAVPRGPVSRARVPGRSAPQRTAPERLSRGKAIGIGIAVAFVGALLVFGVPIYVSAVSGWHTYSAPDGTFTVSLPGEPKRDKEFVEIPGGATYTHSLTLTRGSYEYAISYFSLPRGWSRSNDGVMVEAARQHIVQQNGGEVLQEEMSSTAARIRMRFRDVDPGSGGGPVSGDLHVEIRVISDRVYIIGVSTPVDKLDSAAAQRFLHSFRIGGKPILDTLPEWVKL